MGIGHGKAAMLLALASLQPAELAPPLKSPHTTHSADQSQTTSTSPHHAPQPSGMKDSEIENECGGAWQCLIWQILRGADINWNDKGAKGCLAIRHKNCMNVSFGGAALLKGSARCEELTRQELADCS